MKIAKFITAKYAFPYPDGHVFAPYDVADSLTRGLLDQGHDVTWFAPKGTKTPATLIDCGFTAMFDRPDWQQMPPTMKHEMAIWGDGVFLSHLATIADQFDVIHLDTFLLALPFARLVKDKPIVLTLHNPLDVPNIPMNVDAHLDLQNLHFVSISQAQRQPLPQAPWAATIYHGLATKNYPWQEKSDDRWLFVSRIIPQKGAHIAAKLAQELNEPLDIIGPIDQRDQAYFDEQIKPFVDGKQVRYLGAKAHNELPVYYAKAKGFLFPIQKTEAFGLVVIEALAAGTPVVAFNLGSMSELITSGKDGFVVETEAEMAEAMKKIATISRAACRQTVIDRFSEERVVNDYIKLFESIRTTTTAKQSPHHPWWKLKLQ
ncbi:MAG TPA: glycosyltransferase family 4 protein [Candidatus Saccharimonadales bacterium]|nr:glycosyltransferase family 4 protein [Candidatus Saccharimonadales bacterium]